MNVAINADGFIEFIKLNNLSGVPNPRNPMDTITLQDLELLMEAYKREQRVSHG